MRTSDFSPSVAPLASASPFSFGRFPNARRFAPIFSGCEAPPAPSSEAPNPDAAFFSEFEPSLVEAARRLTTPTAEILFGGFGFATFDAFERRFADSSGGSSEALLFADADGARFLFLAPTPTLRLLFDAALGFDVAAICANEALWSDFNADAQTPPTPFEQETIAQVATRFTLLSPVASLLSASADAWRLVSFPSTPTRAALELDDALFYWERRFLRISERLFPWTLVFSTRFLAPLADAALPPSASPRSTRLPQSPQSFSNAFPSSPNASSSAAQSPNSARSSNSCSSPDLELAVVVERGEMPADAWRRLKPGDVLTTDVPANALFLALVNDAPRFLCRPGLFRGAAAVQIQSCADDARE